MNSVRDEAIRLKNLGNEYASQGLFEEAEELYDKAQKVDETYAVPFLNCGRVCISQNKLEKAIDKLKKAVELDPNDVDGYLFLGDAYMNNNAPIDAIATYSLGLEKDAACAKLYFGRAYARNAVWHPALVSYTMNHVQESTEIEDDDLLDLAGKIIGDFKAALEHGIDDSDRVVTYENIATTYSQIGDHDNAILYLGKCVGLDDTYEEAYRLLGGEHWSLYLKYWGAYYDTKGLEQENNRVQGIEHLKIAKENFEKAVKHYREKLDLTPEQNKLLGRALETLDSMQEEFRKRGIPF
ncbi:hypothetical protein R80B4_02304 [Fibrobacteres bacterium R8-0-B4]